MKVVSYSTAVRYFDNVGYSTPLSGNKSGVNGQIQLWQFLLELLTTREYKSVIQWIGKLVYLFLNNHFFIKKIYKYFYNLYKKLDDY